MIVRESISEAFSEMLRSTLQEGPFMQVTRVSIPVWKGEVNESPAIRRAFDEFQFPDGRSGSWWIEDRIKALFATDGEYYEPLRRGGQLDYAVSTLEGMREGSVARWNANRTTYSLP